MTKSEVQILESPEREETERLRRTLTEEMDGDGDGPQDEPIVQGSEENDLKRSNYMLNSVSVDPDEEAQREDLRRQLKKKIVKRQEPPRDPYVDRAKDQKKYAKQL